MYFASKIDKAKEKVATIRGFYRLRLAMAVKDFSVLIKRQKMLTLVLVCLILFSYLFKPTLNFFSSS